MSRKELEQWLVECQGRLRAAEAAGDEQAAEDIMEEMAYIMVEIMQEGL